MSASTPNSGPAVPISLRARYQERMQAIERAFQTSRSGIAAIEERSQLMDAVVRELWLAGGVDGDAALIAIGGYGRKELYPCSDVDLLILLRESKPSRAISEAIRRFSQQLWDCGIRVAPVTRSPAECERFDPNNVEFVIAMLDRRFLAGNEKLYDQLADKVLPKLLTKEGSTVLTLLQEMTAERHGRYGNTLFHLEPNIKECPGGLRDAHVCGWLAAIFKVSKSKASSFTMDDDTRFREAFAFLATVRTFLHYRHQRDDNTLGWQAQDTAAAERIGLSGEGRVLDAAYWMRAYFRQARIIERRTLQLLDEIPVKSRLPRLARSLKPGGRQTQGYRQERGTLFLNPVIDVDDPAHDIDIILNLFQSIADQGLRLSRETEARVEDALPYLSSHLEDGPVLWNHLKTILKAPFAGKALRTMHALGILELILPEFHGIDALVIRDAYHRYTVDEHTFLLIDILHGLESVKAGPLVDWAPKFATIRNDIEHPALLYLAALMHDTGKGRSDSDHSISSARMAESVCARLELDSHETDLVTGLILNHLAMSQALRRDIFDMETVSAFAEKVPTPEQLRMLVVFTYADIHAVHPDALTPWKAENLWRLYIATSNFLDRSVDEDRVDTRNERELIQRITALQPAKTDAIHQFLEGLPQRYLHTCTPEQIRAHFLMAEATTGEDPIQVDLREGAGDWEITLVAKDRPMLFNFLTGALTGLGMNIVSADAFSNAHGVVVDSFRFVDTFRTLEMNPTERHPFLKNVHDVVAGKVPLDRFLAGRRRSRRRTPLTRVETRIAFDDRASSHSTLLQVVAQDVPGLLHALSDALANDGCNIEVALIDTEGETAIDVFYVTRDGAKLSQSEQEDLRRILSEAVAANAS